MSRIECFIPLEPRGQARARHATINGRSMAYKIKEQKLDEAKLAAYIMEASKGRRLSGPLRFSMVARIEVPQSWSRKRRKEALEGITWPDKKPDLSNIVKHVEDVAQGIIFDDDKSICQILCSKIYSDQPGYEIIFEELSTP